MALKKNPIEWKKGCCRLFLTARGALFPPETFSITFITCSHASAWQRGFSLGDRVIDSVILPAADTFCFVYRYFTGFGQTVLSPE